MANNYTDGCTYIRKEFLPHRGKILKAWEILSERDNPELAFNIDDWCGFEIEAADDGGLYIGSSASGGWFNEHLFRHFIGLMLKNGWIDLDHVTIELSFHCDKLRPDNFGGSILRVYRDGRLEGLSTCSLADLPQDLFDQVCAIANTPSCKPSS